MRGYLVYPSHRNVILINIIHIKYLMLLCQVLHSSTISLLVFVLELRHKICPINQNIQLKTNVFCTNVCV